MNPSTSSAADTDPLNVVGSTAMVNGQPRTPVKAMSSNPAGAPLLDCWFADKLPPDLPRVDPSTLERQDMSEARFLIGDVFDRMADIPDGSIDLIVTSPPFLALRSYLPDDHPDKAKEIGSEPTPAAFLSTLLALTREWRRVLAPHGSICVELGDTYSGSGGAGGDYAEGGMRDGAPSFDGSAKYARIHPPCPPGHDPKTWRPLATTRAGRNTGGGRGWPLAKSLCLLPTLYPASLAYGRNLLAPDDILEPWKVRNLIIWHRPNPPVGALGDKVRPSTSYITTACVSDKRWFDLDSERTVSAYQDDPRHERPGAYEVRKGRTTGYFNSPQNPAGAPLLDCWTIPTAPYAGSHYATFPPAIPRRLINLMCPRQVCQVCGEPRRRITSEPEYVNSKTGKPTTTLHFNGDRRNDGENNWDTAGQGDRAAVRVTETLGWSDCGHNTWRRGIVLDPFAGSGTTLQAASELGRDSIGIDLDSRNLDLARQRLGMFLVEEDEVVA